MYQIRIKTKYNTINMQVENYDTPQMEEIFNQPYVEEIYIEKINKPKIKKLDLPKK